MTLVQLPLPTMATSRPRRARSNRARGYVRVWSDPAVLQAEAEAGHQFEEWQQAFAGFLQRLSPNRRAELRSRLGNPESTQKARL